MQKQATYKVLDYAPFGMQVPSRSFSGTSGYKFGFNGMLKDGKDWTGNNDSHLDFGARIYDSRLGRWLATDPLEIKYPSLSSYSFVDNSPILFIDPDGKRIVNSRKMVLSNKTLIKKLKEFDLAVARITGKNISSFEFVISGGDRYKKGDKIYSATNHSHIGKSALKSQHIQEEGATGVDLKFAKDISYETIKQASIDIGFRLDPSGTYDDHFHLDMKNMNIKMEYNPSNYVPNESDFSHGYRDFMPMLDISSPAIMFESVPLSNVADAPLGDFNVSTQNGGTLNFRDWASTKTGKKIGILANESLLKSHGISVNGFMQVTDYANCKTGWVSSSFFKQTRYKEESVSIPMKEITEIKAK